MQMPPWLLVLKISWYYYCSYYVWFWHYKVNSYTYVHRPMHNFWGFSRLLSVGIPGEILEVLLSGFQHNWQLSVQIQGFVKRGAYFSSRSLKQGVWGTRSPRSYRIILFFKEQNDTNHEICITQSHKRID